MSELTTGDINFGYQSPISQIYKDVEYKFKEDMENKIMEAVHHFGISIDKEELIKALQYDRNQYEKGYSDGRASIVEELEKIKDEIQDYEIMSVNGNSPENVFYIARDLFIRVIDRHISEQQ